MDFFKELFSPGSNSIASTLMLYSFVIAVGIYLGKRKLFGISLGVTFVLFIGIVMGSFGYCVDENILKFIREFGLILFIFSACKSARAFSLHSKKAGCASTALPCSLYALALL